MLELFDGFIAAVGAETHIEFLKSNDGEYIAVLQFEGGRSQKVLIVLNKDDAGDPLLNYFSVIQEDIGDDVNLYKKALQLNVDLSYGSLTLQKKKLIIRYSYFLKNLDPETFIKTLTYVAAKADEFEEAFAAVDKN